MEKEYHISKKNPDIEPFYPSSTIFCGNLQLAFSRSGFEINILDNTVLHLSNQACPFSGFLADRNFPRSLSEKE